jgi:hypothetical protein
VHLGASLALFFYVFLRLFLLKIYTSVFLHRAQLIKVILVLRKLLKKLRVWARFQMALSMIVGRASFSGNAQLRMKEMPTLKILH